VTSLVWSNPKLAQQQTKGYAYDIPLITSWASFIETTIQNELAMNGLNPTPPLPGDTNYGVNETGSGVLLEVAQMWLCRDIRNQQKFDGTYPDSLAEGTQKEAVSINDSIERFDKKGRDALDKYIRANTGAELDSADQYAGMMFLAGEDL
jgi:hypothetical protein